MSSKLSPTHIGFTTLMRSSWFIHVLQYVPLSDFVCAHCSAVQHVQGKSNATSACRTYSIGAAWLMR